MLGVHKKIDSFPLHGDSCVIVLLGTTLLSISTWYAWYVLVSQNHIVTLPFSRGGLLPEILCENSEWLEGVDVRPCVCTTLCCICTLLHLVTGGVGGTSSSQGCWAAGVTISWLHRWWCTFSICLFVGLFEYMAPQSRTLSARRLPLAAMTQVMVRVLVSLFVCLPVFVFLFDTVRRQNHCNAIWFQEHRFFVSAGLVL